MTRRILLIAPEPPPFGGMANQGRLLFRRLSETGVSVELVPTNKAPTLFPPALWTLPVFRTIGKWLVYMAGVARSIRACGTIHILACSHLYFYLNVFPAVIMGRLFRKRVVVNYRGGEAESFYQGFARHFLWIFKLADSTVVPSGYLKSVFNEIGIETNIIPNISEIERFRFRMPDYKKNVKFVCTRNFEAYYDIMTLVRAFKMVKKHLPDASLTLIGAGSLRPHIVDYVQKNNLTDCVAFPGRVEPKDMPAHLEAHDIYVNSSVVDNYPISILEAFSSGLPVVSTAAGGIPYMVAQGKRGILVEPKNHEALAGEMVYLANNLPLGKAFAAKAKKFADDHSWEKIWPKLKRIYQ
jgi:L-malate glycosyltransferase